MHRWSVRLVSFAEKNFNIMNGLSVIIPTHNRCRSLLRLLQALASQEHPMHLVEVVVVANGCTDNTIDVLRKSSYPFRLVQVVSPQPGAARARQLGAEKARGGQLVFLDDDIEPLPGMLSAFAASMEHPRMVVMGQLTMMPDGQYDHQRILLLQWWEQKYREMGTQGHRFRYDDLLSGCFSISASMFIECGGFDVSLGCREDYELGIRLMQAQAEFRYQPKAAGIHHDITNRKGGYRRKKEEGYWDMVIGRKYPAYLRTTRLQSLLPRKHLMDLFFRWPWLYAWAASFTEWRYRWYSRMKLRSAMLAASQFLQDLAYLQGVKACVGDLRVLEAIPGSAGPQRTQTLTWNDLVSMQEEDIIDSGELVIRYGSWELCRVASEFAAEPLRKRHLVQYMLRFHKERVAQAMALEQMEHSMLKYGGCERSVV